MLSDQWFDDVQDFSKGFAQVYLNDKYNFIDTEGKLLSNQWFDWADDFSDGYAEVRKDGVSYRIDTKGNLTPLG